MGVASALFSLFIASYLMRMNASDWSPIAMPQQLWLSTALLVAGSVALQLASAAAWHARRERMRALLAAGGICALAFLCVQLWAWQSLFAMRVMPAGNPAASFFYLLTAMHGLHVTGGLVAWAMAMRRSWSAAAATHPDRLAWSITLCARYWHFLLGLWVVLFATLGGVTPAVVSFICGTR
jgi:cytochrome c oxidase subunit 3